MADPTVEPTADPTAELLPAAEAIAAEVTDLRRRLHRRPEIGLDLPETRTLVLEALDGLPLALHQGQDCSSVIAVLDGAEPGPTVLLRGDLDALPLQEDTGLDFASEIDGAMHACGHDSHTAMLAGAARLLAERRGGLAGRVVFMFQPGEEGYGGAEVMLREGLLEVAAAGAEPVSMAFALHQSPSMPSGMIATKRRALMASSDEFAITVHSGGGHASMPHDTIDPIFIAAEITVAIQAAVARRVDVFDPAVITVSKVRAGTAANVIPTTARLWGTIRAVSPRTRAQAAELLNSVATGIARAHGTTATVEVTLGYPVTSNHDHATGFALDVSRGLLGADRVVEMPTPVMGSEDWSYVLEQVPGAMAFLGTRPPGVRASEASPNHSATMVLDEAAMVPGTALLAAVATNWLATGFSEQPAGS